MASTHPYRSVKSVEPARSWPRSAYGGYGSGCFALGDVEDPVCSCVGGAARK
jgi:hypothetical protein